MKNKLKLVTILFLAMLFVSGCASWQRMAKSVSSEFKNGIDRELIIKSQIGEIVYEDSGKFDIEVNDYRVKYIDEENKIHIIYLGASTAIVNEK